MRWFIYFGVTYCTLPQNNPIQNPLFALCQLVTHVVCNGEDDYKGRCPAHIASAAALFRPWFLSPLWRAHIHSHNEQSNIRAPAIHRTLTALLLAFDVCLCMRINKGRVCVAHPWEVPALSTPCPSACRARAFQIYCALLGGVANWWCSMQIFSIARPLNLATQAEG